MVQGEESVLIERAAAELFQFLGPEFFVHYPFWEPDLLELRQTSEPRPGSADRVALGV